MGWIVLLLLASLPVGMWFGLAWFSLHPPRAPLFLSPFDFGLPFETVQFSSRDGLPLRGWWIPHDNAKGVVVVCHGYLVNRCEVAGVGAVLHRAGFAVLMFDFRAHGKSGGALCTLGAREAEDVLGALDWLQERAPGVPIAAFGSSMGGAAVILAAARDTRIEAVAADCAFCDLKQAGADWWDAQSGPRIGRLLRPANLLAVRLARTRFAEASPQRVIAQIAPRPVLLLHAEGDRLVPVRHAHALFEAAQEPKTLRLFPDSGHVQMRADTPPAYYAALLPFFEAWAATRQAKM